jgi:hypothetical protein
MAGAGGRLVLPEWRGNEQRTELRRHDWISSSSRRLGGHLADGRVGGNGAWLADEQDHRAAAGAAAQESATRSTNLAGQDRVVQGGGGAARSGALGR